MSILSATDSSISSIVLQGKTLEAQFCVDYQTFLLVMTDDRPYEETLRFYLVSDQMHVLDQLVYDAPYQAMIVQSCEVSNANTVQITANDQQQFSLQVSETPASTFSRTLGSTQRQKYGKYGRLVLRVL
ncbi:MAG: hypothetical protein R3C53_05970 [Pirellulaceae bacterium]